MFEDYLGWTEMRWERWEREGYVRHSRPHLEDWHEEQGRKHPGQVKRLQSQRLLSSEVRRPDLSYSGLLALKYRNDPNGFHLHWSNVIRRWISLSNSLNSILIVIVVSLLIEMIIIREIFTLVCLVLMIVVFSNVVLEQWQHWLDSLDLDWQNQGLEVLDPDWTKNIIPSSRWKYPWSYSSTFSLNFTSWWSCISR